MGSSHGVGVVSGGVRGRELFDSKQWGAPLRNVNMGKESVGSPAFSCELGMWRAEPRTPLFYFIQIFRLVQLHDTDRSVASLHERSLIVHTYSLGLKSFICIENASRPHNGNITQP